MSQDPECPVPATILPDFNSSPNPSSRTFLGSSPMHGHLVRQPLEGGRPDPDVGALSHQRSACSGRKAEGARRKA